LSKITKIIDSINIKEYGIYGAIYGAVIVIFISFGYIRYERSAYETKLSLKDEQIKLLERQNEELNESYSILKDKFAMIEMFHKSEISLLERKGKMQIEARKELEKQLEWFKTTYRIEAFSERKANLTK